MIISPSLSHSQGVLLLNLGTPDSPGIRDVRKYLKQFLMDPWVLDIPTLFRWMLVNLIILPTRPQRSSLAYGKVWTERGSPLLYHLEDLAEAVKKNFGNSIKIEFAMRYGNPSMEVGFQRLYAAGVRDFTLLPLYPQYSLAATESSVQEWNRISKKSDPSLKFSVIPPFFNDAGFIRSFATVARESLATFPYDHLLFSFHGLPERQVVKTDVTREHCLKSKNCCDQISEVNSNCYRAQCFATAQRIAQELKLATSQYTVCFQSRLGRTPWIKPYTDFLYRELPSQGVKRLAVICPAFVADCLETLEEVQIRGREEFLKYGGEELKLIPSLNSSAVWVEGVTQLITRHLS